MTGSKPIPITDWIEMRDLRRKSFQRNIWIPLRQIETISIEGEENSPGFREETLCVNSIAFYSQNRKEGELCSWDDMGVGYSAKPYAFEDGKYKEADVFLDRTEDKKIGISPILINEYSEPKQWLVNQDIVLALKLIQEGNTWLRPQEFYTEVIRQRIGSDGEVTAIEIKAEFLKDYLAARGMALRLSYYRERIAILSEDTIQFDESKEPSESFEIDKLVIGPDGLRADRSIGVFRTWRTDVYPDDDIPNFEEDNHQNTASESYGYKIQTQVQFLRVRGALWKDEWIEPSPKSERVRRDKTDEVLYYLTDNSGNKKAHQSLNREDIKKYLWFRPQIIVDLLSKREGRLYWHTAQTGGISSPSYGGIHFGVNSLGLINVYAYDIARLPLWEQRLWIGHNVSPDGGVSEELLAAQMGESPADTKAPEVYFSESCENLNNLFIQWVGSPLIKSSDFWNNLIKTIHRFRSLDQASLLALAKDIARLTIDSFDVNVLRNIVNPPKEDKSGSRKLLQQALESISDKNSAYQALTPLAGIYDLRLGDAHPTSDKVFDAYKLVGIDDKQPFIGQGYQLIQNAACSLNTVAQIIQAYLNK